MGFEAHELAAAGYTVRELRDGGYQSADELRAAGCTVRDLKDGGFNARALRKGGFTAEDLTAGGFNAKDLKEGGFSVQELKDADVPAEAVVAIMAEGKEHACAIGVTTMSTEQIRSENKGIAVENTHWLKDGLWSMRGMEQ